MHAAMILRRQDKAEGKGLHKEWIFIEEET